MLVQNYIRFGFSSAPASLKAPLSRINPLAQAGYLPGATPDSFTLTRAGVNECDYGGPSHWHYNLDVRQVLPNQYSPTTGKPKEKHERWSLYRSQNDGALRLLVKSSRNPLSRPSEPTLQQAAQLRQNLRPYSLFAILPDVVEGSPAISSSELSDLVYVKPAEFIQATSLYTNN